MLRERRKGGKEQEKWLGSKDARSKSIPPIQGCRQEACSSSAINLACVMAERACCRSFLDEESRAGIISFVHRLPGEIPLTGRIEEIAEVSASTAAATTSRSDNRRSLYFLFVLLLAFVPTCEQSKDRESLEMNPVRVS